MRVSEIRCEIGGLLERSQSGIVLSRFEKNLANARVDNRGIRVELLCQCTFDKGLPVTPHFGQKLGIPLVRSRIGIKLNGPSELLFGTGPILVVVHFYVG